MSFFFLIVGTILVVSTVRNTQDTLVQTVKGDFTGSGNFVYWIVAILIIGAVGAIQKFKAVSDAFLALILIVLFLKRGNPNQPGGGFFNQFVAAIGGTTANQPSTTTSGGSSNFPIGIGNTPTPGSGSGQTGSTLGGGPINVGTFPSSTQGTVPATGPINGQIPVGNQKCYPDPSTPGAIICPQ